MFDLYDDDDFERICALDPECSALAGNEVSDYGLVEQIVAAERAIARAQAEQFQLINLLHDRYVVVAAEQKAAREAERAAGAQVGPESAFGTGPEQASVELSMALRISGHSASGKIHDAVELTHRFPAALAEFAKGTLTWSKIRILTEQTLNMSDDDKTIVTDRVLGRAEGQTPAAFRRSVRNAVERTDADALRRRRAAALEDRGVWIRELPDGMAELTALLPAAEAVGVYAVLDELARQTKHDTPADEHVKEWARDEDGRTQANRRADALADLVLGPIEHPAAGSKAAMSTRGPLWRRNLKIDIRVTVPLSAMFGIDETPADLTGYGPLSADQARQLAAHGTWRRILTDPATGNPIDFGTTRYKPPPLLRDAILTTHPECTRPSCAMTAAHSDLDHHEPHHATGETTYDGTGPKCRRDHRIKQTPGWNVEHHPDGTATWTTPSGHTYEYEPKPIAEPVKPPASQPDYDDEPPF